MTSSNLPSKQTGNAPQQPQLTRRKVVKAAAGIAAAAAWSFAMPRRAHAAAPIKMVLSVAAGGSLDSMMRVIGQKLTESWGQPVVIETKPGANGVIAARYVAQSSPDGLTLLVTNFSLLSNTVLVADPGYQLSDLVPVSIMVQVPIAIGVRPSLGVKTLKQYVDLAKANPKKYFYGTWGVGSGGHFLAEQLNLSAGIETTHVPYKGEAPVIQDLLGGQIDVGFTGLGIQVRQEGNVMPLAVTGNHRFSTSPDIPTFAEAGFPEPGRYLGWNGLLAPAATPKPQLEKLTTEIIRIVKLPEVSKQLLDLDFDPVALSPAESSQLMNNQLVSIKRMVADGRVKI